MILITRLGGPQFALNPDLIERVEATPDTVITLVSGNKYVIRESVEELIELIFDHRAQVIAAAEQLGAHTDYAAAAASRRRQQGSEPLTAVPAVVPLHPREG